MRRGPWEKLGGGLFGLDGALLGAHDLTMVKNNPATKEGERGKQ
jgi:hypothetical protein